MKLPKDIDKECISLCEAINKIPGISTEASCCGHGKTPFSIFLGVRLLDNLPILLYYLDSCHTGIYGWECKVKTDCGMSPAYFYIESESIGEKAYREADRITEAINEYLKGRKKHGRKE